MASSGRPQTLTTLRILWVALLMAIVIYGVIVFLVVPEGAARKGFSNPLVMPLYAAAAATAAAAFFVPRMLARRELETRGAAPAAPLADVMVDPKVATALIVRFAMLDAVAIFGLVAAFLDGSPVLFLPPGAVAVVGMLLAFPSSAAARSM